MQASLQQGAPAPAVPSQPQIAPTPAAFSTADTGGAQPVAHQMPPPVGFSAPGKTSRSAN